MSVTESPSCAKCSWAFDGRSEHPMGGCSRPNQLRCRGCSAVRVVRCRSARSRCRECSERYRKQVRRVAVSGVVALPGRDYLLTLTAPGAQEHFLPNGEPCSCTRESNKLDDEIAVAQWNGECVHRWNRLRQDMERALGVTFQYFKAVEPQDRGALHLHVIVRFDQPCNVRLAELRRLAIGQNFGHSVRFDPVRDERASWYVAKYVTKCSDERELVPYCHRKSGEVAPGRWRTWTSSRRWGESMGSVRASQRAWVEEQRLRTAVGGEWTQSAAAGAGAAGALDHSCLRYAEGPLLLPLGEPLHSAM